MKTREYEVKIPSELLDFLLKNVGNESRNNLKNYLKNHQILVNGKPVTQYNYLLKEKDVVTISYEPVNSEGTIQSKLEIIYEDEDFLAVNKPAGILAVEDAKEKVKTAFNLMNDYYQKIHPGQRLYILHRIDKETSGVLVFAKSSKIKNALQDDWNTLVTKREYTAIVEGVIPKKVGKITSYLIEEKNSLVHSTKDEKRGSLAITNYEVLKESGKYSLLKVSLETGRKNQIRVHMKEMNHPIIGDDKYGHASNPIGRLGLHNKIIEFTNPLTNKKIIIKAQDPREFFKLFK